MESQRSRTTKREASATNAKKLDRCALGVAKLMKTELGLRAFTVKGAFSAFFFSTDKLAL